MNKINFLILFATLVMFASCESMLEQENPNQQDSSNFWETEKDLRDGLNAAYRPLRFVGTYRRWLHVLYVSRSDEGYSVSPNTTFRSYSNFNTQNDDNSQGVRIPWIDLYKGVFWANQVLAHDDIVLEVQSDMDKIMAQAYFLRGVSFFNIAGVYGRGPISLLPELAENPPVYEQRDIYLQAQKDFEKAYKSLPVVWPDMADLGRITKGAALGMLVKVSAQLRDWESVKNYCDSIFSLGIYELVADYNDNFTETAENNSESLFEVQFIAGPVSGVKDPSQERAKFLGLPANGQSYDDGTASNIVKIDLEKEKTKTGQTDSRLKHTLFYYDVNDNTQYYGRTFRQWTNGGTVKQDYVYWKKYTQWDKKTEKDPESHDNNGINFRVIRLADIYLMYAEALNELERTSEAYEYINKVRRRVNLPDLENSTVFTGIGNDQEKMREQIMHERSCELAGESWRWLDLERWRMFESQEKISWLATRDNEFKDFTIGKSNRFPIPYAEIALVPGLVQNSGY